MATVVQLSGPNAVQLIVPPAGPPTVVGLITGLPGWLAVPRSVAVSLIAWPSVTPALACVVSVGCTGVTLKHSVRLVVLLGSDEFGTPVVVEVKLPRQQYLPTEVIVAAAELTVGLLLLTPPPAIAVPPVLQLAWLVRSAGPQR